MRWIWLLPLFALGYLLMRGDAIHSPHAAAAEINPNGEVILFETEWCGACKQVARCLERSDVPFQRRNVEASAQFRQEFRALGGRGVPLTLVGDEAIIGMNGRRIDQALGKLGHQGRCG